MTMLNWDDLRVFLAVARAGRFIAAARGLGLDHKTVARRVEALEAAMGSELLVRSPRGVALTTAGSSLLAHAKRIEAEATSASALIGGRDAELSGAVRLATPEALGTYVVARAMPAFHQRYPKIQLELMPESRAVSLSRREADMAVTLSRPSAGRLFARKLADYDLGLYASLGYLKTQGTPRTLEDLPGRPFVGYIEDLVDMRELSYLDKVCGSVDAVFRSSSTTAQHAAVAAGLGIGLLHRFAAAQDPRLVAILPEEVSITRSYWQVFHADQRELPRIRAVADFLETVVTPLRQKSLTGAGASLTGTGASAP